MLHFALLRSFTPERSSTMLEAIAQALLPYVVDYLLTEDDFTRPPGAGPTRSLRRTHAHAAQNFTPIDYGGDRADGSRKKLGRTRICPTHWRVYQYRQADSSCPGGT